MANKVVVQWSTKESIGAGQVRPRQEPRNFESRAAAVKFVMEELEKKQTSQCPDDSRRGGVQFCRHCADVRPETFKSALQKFDCHRELAHSARPDVVGDNQGNEKGESAAQLIL